MLTRKQLDLLEFIHKRVQRDGVPPLRRDEGGAGPALQIRASTA
jgi:SOS-response transcriptional repressor LexA